MKMFFNKFNIIVYILGDKQLVESLIANGANVNYVDVNDNTPLYWAVLRGNFIKMDIYSIMQYKLLALSILRRNRNRRNINKTWCRRQLQRQKWKLSTLLDDFKR